MVRRPGGGLGREGSPGAQETAGASPSTDPGNARSTPVLGGSVETILASAPVFRNLGPSTVARLAAECTRRTVAGGEVLLRQGDPPRAAYVVVRGRVRVERAGGDAVHDRGDMGPGDVVGELGLLTGQPRAATVVAVRDTEVLELSAEAFRALVRRHPDVLMDVTAAIVDRLVADDASAAPTGHPTARTVAAVAGGEAPATTVSGFAHYLAAALGGERPGRAVGSCAAEAAAGDGVAQVGGSGRRADELSCWMAELEVHHDGVVFEADGDWTPWSERCVRQADHLVIVAEAGGPSATTAVERRALELARGRKIPVQLVLVHPASTTLPSRTAAWLADRDVDAHHHVRAGSIADVARVARRLQGRAVGLVLGGGGPRGFAHLGTLTALEEAGVAIDAVGGTSIGAVMGLMPCLGWDAATATERALDAFMGTRLMSKTLPLVSISSGRRLTQMLRSPSFLGETAIEDLWLPFFCISANLTQATVVVHDRGPAWRAVRASSSLPGVLPPVHHDGELLVDGGVVDDLPVGIMRERITGPVIAVDLSPGDVQRVHMPFDTTLSGWRVLARRLLPGVAQVDVPNLVEVLLRAKDVGGRLAHRERLSADPPDLHLRPPTDGFGALDFSAAPELLRVGYEHARDALASGAAAHLLPGAVPPSEGG